MDIPTKTFKEVHEDLDNEQLFLKKSHDIKGFKEKADFLKNIGFTNSIATKLYTAVADNHSVVQQYDAKYLGLYKFILKPQLERLCEKYNLFVREPKHFLGDMPESNIKEMMNFSIYSKDLPIDILDVRPRSKDEHERFHYSTSVDATYDLWLSHYRAELYKHLGFDMMPLPSHDVSDFKIPIALLRQLGFGGAITIAAVENLFDTKAFEKSRSRIIGRTELQPKNQVDLDPIVLCETKHGYIVVTAWGDEANDELILNNIKN